MTWRLCALLAAFLGVSGWAAALGSAAERTVQEVYERAAARLARIHSVEAETQVLYERLAEPPSAKQMGVGRGWAKIKTDGRRVHIRHGDASDRNQVYLHIFDGASSLEVADRSPKQAIFVRSFLPSLNVHECYVESALQFPYTPQSRANYDIDWFFPHMLREIDGQSLYRVVETATLDGAECVILEYPGLDKIWVDMRLDGVLRRRERFNPSPDGTSWPFTTTEFFDFREIPPGVHVPFRLVDTIFAQTMDPPEWKGVAAMRTTVTVDKIVLNQVTDADFAPKLSPGTLIFTEDNQQFYVPGEGSPEKLEDLVRQLPPPLRPRRNLAFWFAVGLATLAVLFWLTLPRRPKSDSADNSREQAPRGQP